MNSHIDIMLLDKNMLDEATEVLLAAWTSLMPDFGNYIHMR